MRTKTTRATPKKPAGPHKNSKKKMLAESCFCKANPDIYRSAKCDWEEIFEIPGIKDITVIANDKSEFKTCKILFSTLGPNIANRLDRKTIKLNCSLSVVQILHTFTLNGEFNCDSTTLEPLLRVAKDYDMPGIKLFGGLHLMTLINGSNVIEMLQLSNELLCPHFVSQIKSYILDNFEELGKQRQFLGTCSPMWMEEFVKNEMLNASEENIFKILMAWTKITKEREQAVSDIAKHIRFSIMDEQFFNNVVLANNPFIEKAWKEIPRRVHRAKKYRIPNELVFSMGGFTSEPCSTVELFNVRSNTWTTLSLDFVPHAYHGMVAMDKKIFVFGGFGDSGNGPEYFRTAFCYDLQSKTWSRISSMNTPRCYISVAELNGKIYCIGGCDGVQRFSSVECYDPASNQWSMVKSMNFIRSDASAVTDGKNKIYVMGGFNGDAVIPNVEIYNCMKDEWESGPDMREPRSGLKAVIFKNKLYAIGGFNGNERLRSVECLDLLKPNATWTPSTQLITPRSNFGATVVDKKIFVTGN